MPFSRQYEDEETAAAKNVEKVAVKEPPAGPRALPARGLSRSLRSQVGLALRQMSAQLGSSTAALERSARAQRDGSATAARHTVRRQREGGEG